ncbi:CD44 antigen isoform X2 [Erythrolamprus reginae]|uniref:CD44 antigen isoform X2 n=1 Tax=Erythrolamprus reginae TaxID=121349 RepID=UPI00396CD45C
MAKLWLCAAVGFYVLLQFCAARMDLNISCRYAGVFHVEKNQRYSLTREEAVQLCEALNSTIPTYEQMEKAYILGFETCRYGYIIDKIVLPRHTPYHLCAANFTGIYELPSNISDRYDTYCFNSSELRDKACEPVEKLYSDLPNNNISIEIFNADGSRYFEGKKVTEKPQVTEDDSSVGSGSAVGRGTADPSDFTPEDDITTLTPVYGREDQYHVHPGNPEDQNPQSPTEENSNHGMHHGNSSQDRQITEDFPLWWPPEDHKEMQNTTSSKDQSFEEDDDDGGGDDDDDDDEEGSGQKNPERVHEWDNSGDKELQASNTTVNSSKDVKQEESAHNLLLPAVHSGRDSEVRYSTNDTSSDVLHEIVEQYSTTTVSEQPHLEDASSELQIEDTISPAINNSDVLHPEFSPSNESFHHPVTFFNGSVEHEEEHQHQPSAVDTVVQRNQSSVVNRTIHDILQVLVSSTDSYYENASSQSAVISSANTDSEVPTRDSLLHSEEKYHTSTSKEQLLPGILHTTATTVISTEKGKGNETMQNPSFYDIHPRVDNKNDLPENKTREDDLSEIIQIERKPELETTQTAMISTEADYEDSTQDPLIKEDPDLNEKLHHFTNSSINDFIPGISNVTDNVQENKTSHTDVGLYGTKEDTTSEPVRHWVSEDKYTTKSTVDVLFPGIVPRRGINQNNKTDDTGSDPDKQGSGKSQPRMAHIPDWLIVVASLLALALILGVCIAVNSRRRCGQKKKLVINNGKGGIDEKNKDGLNGEASKSQEMVHLVHKEKPEDQKAPHDEFQAIDETQNQQDMPLKSGM